MEIEFDPQADAIYIKLSEKKYAHGKDIDSERRIDYAEDNTPVGIELLCVSTGVNLSGLPRAHEIGERLKARGFKAHLTREARVN